MVSDRGTNRPAGVGGGTSEGGLGGRRTERHVTRAWVYAETRRNVIPHLRLGRYVRYRRAAPRRDRGVDSAH